MGEDERTATLGPGAGLYRIIDDTTQELRGVVEIGLGPLAIGRVGLGALADRHELMVDDEARLV